MGSRGLDSIRLGWGQILGACKQGNEVSYSIKVGNILPSWATISFSGTTLHRAVAQSQNVLTLIHFTTTASAVFVCLCDNCIHP